MIDTRTNEIGIAFKRWLERYSPPLNIRNNSRAVDDEANALFGVLLKLAPNRGYNAFLETVFDQLEYQMKTRTWPTKNELGAACSNVRKENKHSYRDADEPRQKAISEADRIAQKMLDGGPVPETWLYGKRADELLATGFVDDHHLGQYKQVAYNSRANLYGQTSAEQWWMSKFGSEPVPDPAHATPRHGTKLSTRMQEEA